MRARIATQDNSDISCYTKLANAWQGKSEEENADCEPRGFPSNCWAGIPAFPAACLFFSWPAIQHSASLASAAKLAESCLRTTPSAGLESLQFPLHIYSSLEMQAEIRM